MNWEIADANGTIYTGTQPEIQLIWDLIFRNAQDIANEYRRKYSLNEIMKMKGEYLALEWSGELKQIQIHERRKTKVQARDRFRS